jgi:3-phenylpropionate/trans-cinnamate dioxygenase ferredoxin reductase subunit
VAHGIVIAGASLAGLRTAEELRRLGSTDPIVLIDAGTEPPYDRPPLSKDILLGKKDEADIRLASAEALADAQLELKLGVRAIGVDPAKRALSTTEGDLRYDELVIATGSSARRLPFGHLEGVHVLRTLADALALRRAFETRPRIAVIGGGVIGSEVAASARSLGLDVTIVDPLRVLMQRVVGDVIGERMAALHAAEGVTLRLGTSVTAVLGDGAVAGLALGDGTEVAADLVVVGIGAEPCTRWLDGTGLDIDDGVRCDEYLQAGPGIHAVGDVARWFHPILGEHVRMEHWTSAVEHAQAVAATLTGERTAVTSVPYVWTDQYGRKLQVAGRVHEDDEVRFLRDEGDRFLAVTGNAGVQHAAIGMGAAAAFVKQRRAMAERRAPWPPEPLPVQRAS